MIKKLSSHLPSGTTIWPVFYDATDASGMRYRGTVQQLNKKVDVSTPMKVPPTLRNQFPMMLEYSMHLFPNPIMDHRLNTNIVGFVFMDNDRIDEVSV